jgi:type I restriction enzyme M protein
VLIEWLKLSGDEADLKKRLKEGGVTLDAQVYGRYPKLAEAEIKTLVVDKWLAALDAAIHGEMGRVSQQFTERVKELAERYDATLSLTINRATELEAKFNAKFNRHLERMGFAWN